MNDFGDRLRRHVRALTPEQPAPFPEVLTRRDRRRRRRRALAAAGTAMVAVAVVAVAIGAQATGSDGPHDSGRPATSSPSPSPAQTPRAEPTYELSSKPSPVVLRLVDGDLVLKPSSYCWQGPSNGRRSLGGCADGFWPTKDLEGVGSPTSVDFWFGVDGWDFGATFTELGEDCPRQYSIQAVTTGDHLFRLDPAGPKGRYRVDLFGRGRHGDVSASFRWTTTVDGPIDQPTAGMALIAGSGDELETYGLSLGVGDLAFQPREAHAEVTVTAANGRSMVLGTQRNDLPAPNAHVKDGTCYAEGSVSFDGDDAHARQAVRLGPAPFSYEVRLTLDGKRYVGTAVWPRDEIADAEPNTMLSFDPPLPAYEIPRSGRTPDPRQPEGEGADGEDGAEAEHVRR
jgi:hypothetical protein